MTVGISLLGKLWVWMKEYVLKGMKWEDGAAWSIAQGGIA